VFRGVQDWLGALRLARRLTGGRARRGRIAAASGPGAPPRPAARRPADDPALSSRLGRWRGRTAPPASSLPVALTSRETAAAMRDLQALRTRMSPEQAALIDAHLGGGRVTSRRLRPEDGYVWEMPGTRVFAIVGVQAFTVQDED
jgi:hypothetical protein